MVQNIYVLIVALIRAAGMLCVGVSIYFAAICLFMGGPIELAIVGAVAGVTLAATAKLIGRMAVAGL
jgi:hypothetical protein